MTFKISLLVLGLLACSVNAFAEDIPAYPFVFVTGNAEAETPPDIAACSLTIHAIDADAGKAESTVDSRLKALLNVLSQKGVAADDIESFNVNKQILSTAYDEKQPATIRGYDLTRSLSFKVRQLKSLPAIEVEFIGAANLEQINCQFDRTDRHAIEADLVAKALRAAKDQAEKFATPLGRRVTTAQAISQIPFASIPDAFGLGNRATVERMDRMFRKSTTQDDLLVPATIHLQVGVNVLFRME